MCGCETVLRHFLRHIGREVYACMGFLIMAQTPEKLGLWRCIAGNRRTFRYENRHPISIPNFIVFRSPYALEAAEPPVLPDRGAPAGRCPPRRSVKSPEGQAVRRVYPCSLLTLSYHVGGRCTIGKRLRRRKISSPSAQTGAGKPCGPHGPQGFLPMKLSPSYSCA